jgi:hypothetical protein
MSSNSSEAHPKNKVIETLFSKFAAFYGHIWRSQFKSEGFLEFAKKEWQEGLKDFSETIIEKAVIECAKFYELPPTLPQMIIFCREIKKRTIFSVVEKTQTPKNKEIALTQLKKCREILNRK